MAIFETSNAISSQNIAVLKGGTLTAEILSSTALLPSIPTFWLFSRLSFASLVAKFVVRTVLALPSVKTRRKTKQCQKVITPPIMKESNSEFSLQAVFTSRSNPDTS